MATHLDGQSGNALGSFNGAVHDETVCWRLECNIFWLLAGYRLVQWTVSMSFMSITLINVLNEFRAKSC